MTKHLDMKIESCEECPFFTFIWKQSDKYQVRHKYQVPCFVCDHPRISLLQLPNIVRLEAIEIDEDVKNCTPTWEFPHGAVDIPDFCPLKDAREQGVNVGVSVFVFNENKEILVGHRTPDDLWGLPGGGMEAGETPEETAAREVEEETGIVIQSDKIDFATFTNDPMLQEKGEHWITLYFICYFEDWKGEPERKEKNKCSKWKWINVDNLPPNLFCDWGPFMPELKKMMNIPVE